MKKDFLKAGFSEKMHENMVSCTASHDDTQMCLSIGTPININFPYVPDGKYIVLRFPIFKHIRVILDNFFLFPGTVGRGEKIFLS